MMEKSGGQEPEFKLMLAEELRGLLMGIHGTSFKTGAPLPLLNAEMEESSCYLYKQN